jgi:hypothetical protein
MRKHYQNKKIDTSQPAVPETVSVALTELAGELREGLLGHCCIKEKGVLAMAQSSKAGSPGPVEKYDKPGIRGLLRGFRVGR